MNTQFETIDPAQLDDINGGNRFKLIAKGAKYAWNGIKWGARQARDYFAFKGVEGALEGEKKE